MLYEVITSVAGNINVRQKMHGDLDDSVTFTGLASAALEVKAESAWFIAPGTGFRQPGQQIPDRCEHAGT